MTFPADLSQTPRPQLLGLGEPDTLLAAKLQVPYVEGADVGYRWFATQGKQPLFMFGYGLSYTRFEQSAPKIQRGKNISASFKVTNVGEREGADVPQLYLVSAAGKAVKRLVGFQRVSLQPGQTEELTVQIDPRLLAEWDGDGWLIKSGSYGFALGRSAGDLGAVVEIKLNQRRLQP